MRDTIYLSEFSTDTQDAFHAIAEKYESVWHEHYLPEDWAAFYFVLREVPDIPEFFPRGKSATIQIVEGKLIEWAKGVVSPPFR